MKYSNLNEENIIKNHLADLGISKGVCVDIGASDGVDSSNSLALYKNGWSGLAIECNTQKFINLSKAYEDLSQVVLLRKKVSPYNINGILGGFCGAIDFLSIDIDGYDYYVLDAILEQFRPKIICAEINQNIPPPIKFSVKYDPDFFWKQNMFFGMSVSMAGELCKKYNYCLTEVEYTNVFFMPIELCQAGCKSPEEVYDEGFYNRPDKKEKTMFHAPMIELVRSLPIEKKVEYMDNFFAQYKGRFVCYI